MQVSRRHFFFGSLALPALAAKKTAPERPSIILMVMDGLPAWALGFYGNKEILTPNLDRLAQMGTRFINHIACSPAPTLSRATLLSGLTPMQLHDAGEAPAAASLDKILSDAGYSAHTGEISEAGGVLDQPAGGKPFFVTLGYSGLRPPYEGVAQKYRDQYAKTTFDTLDMQRIAAPNARAGREMLADVVGSVRKYAAAVTALDEHVGTLLQKVMQRRLLDNTLLVFTSTCGALLGHHGLWDAGDASEPVNMYEESIVTPLLWSWSGRVPAQAMRPEVVSTYDFVPTICDLIGLDAAENLCGRSYALLATGKPLPKKQPWKTTVFGHYQTADLARGDRYKVVVRASGPNELYDLRDDPGEKTNQYDNQQYLTVRTTLWQGLVNWKQRYSA